MIHISECCCPKNITVLTGLTTWRKKISGSNKDSRIVKAFWSVVFFSLHYRVFSWKKYLKVCLLWFMLSEGGLFGTNFKRERLETSLCNAISGDAGPPFWIFSFGLWMNIWTGLIENKDKNQSWQPTNYSPSREHKSNLSRLRVSLHLSRRGLFFRACQLTESK